ncbi:hypothetical protein E3P92_01268 [Wallemia ichthyophaga]|uniref:RRM domain-containing protein n=2 Tax=Wallemia ichthyophaga TaxID=245174 RepID=A0A4T0J5F7_WALIC|nr:uncharacterized protein J056_000617 [Wallemia ichthyophaga EXF-994]TIA74459.1 hypothetical protein E3P91_00976 [Wallemia ichthyophaga]EOR00807.1 hypothetical protein J056_000617 [Wallemia ichthyophaga EXF-994]TIA82904.1 hypothetical protein E3P98_01067 [Wallemia ichthyophaga]TIA92832.1 hypothetical protein E3P97_01282 [Wallemia ichthyophaga]TIA96985.1 hypothetical protein E3P95_03041 [Wallemia ichthyophaga]
MSSSYGYGDQTLNQQSAYVPTTASFKSKSTAQKMNKGDKRTTVLRKGAGKQWEDTSLLDWDPSHYRLFVGNISNDVTEQVLDETFSVFKSYSKCRVVRDKISNKAKYAFIAFADPEDFLKAWKEYDGKYVGNRPITLSKSQTNIKANDIGYRKSNDLRSGKKNHRAAPY